ncbi:MAG: carbohydrate porin, partial [Phycisphaerales bacterium]
MSRLPGHHRARGTAREHRIAKRLLLACSAIALVQAASAQVQTPTADPPLSETSPPVESSIDPHASDPHAPTRHVDMPRNPGALEGVAADGAAKPDGSKASSATPQRDPQTPSEGVWPWRDETLTGKWGGLRTDLKNAGIDFEASMIFDIVSNFSGGIRTGTDYPHLFNLQLTLDLGKLVGLEGAEIFALGQFEQGQFPSSELVGDFQGVDNIALTTGLAQLSQLWYRQSLLENRLSVQIGQLDYLYTFASPTAGALFINNGMNYPAVSNVSGPFYPNQAFGVVLEGSPVEQVELSLAIYDGTIPPAIGAPSRDPGASTPSTFFDNVAGYFVAGEADFDWTLPGGRSGTIALGGWGHTGEFPTFDGGVQDGLHGFYGYVQQTLWLADEKDSNGPGMNAFLIGGVSEQSANPAAWSLAGGLEWQGPIDGRPQDTAGFGFALVRFTDDATLFPKPYECTLEAFYILQLTPWLSIQPDLQF